MRDRAELNFIRDRVIAYVRSHPPTGPLLTERAPATLAETCRSGHADWRTKPAGGRECRTCAREYKRSRRLKEPAP